MEYLHLRILDDKSAGILTTGADNQAISFIMGTQDALMLGGARPRKELSTFEAI